MSESRVNKDLEMLSWEGSYAECRLVILTCLITMLSCSSTSTLWSCCGLVIVVYRSRLISRSCRWSGSESGLWFERTARTE